MTNRKWLLGLLLVLAMVLVAGVASANLNIPTTIACAPGSTAIIDNIPADEETAYQGATATLDGGAITVTLAPSAEHFYSLTVTVEAGTQLPRTITLNYNPVNTGYNEVTCEIEIIDPEQQIDILGAKVNLSSDSTSYIAGPVIKPTVGSVVLNGTTLTIDDYTVDMGLDDWINAGPYAVTVTGQGKYKGTAVVYFTVTPAVIELSASDISVEAKTYNKTTAATATIALPSGSPSGLSATVNAEFADANVGNGNKTVNLTNYQLSGTGSDNYTLTGPESVTNGTINPLPITVTGGITASDKTYDGNTEATLTTTGATFNPELYQGDTLTVTATGTYVDANAGEDKTVTISDIAVSGNNNYELNNQGNLIFYI